MTSEFRFLQINSLAEVERYGVKEFAAEFGHDPIGLPIWLFFHRDDLMGYWEVRTMPLIYPAIHPKISPRVFLEGGRLLCSKFKEHFPGAFVVYGSATVKAQHMAKVGFELSPMQFFEPKEEPTNGS